MSDQVLVIGAGIAGIQTSLDLAAAGARVVLVERSPSLGGKMAALDKNFPTLDCSICIEAPMMSEINDNANIEVLTKGLREAKRVTEMVVKQGTSKRQMGLPPGCPNLGYMRGYGHGDYGPEARSRKLSDENVCRHALEKEVTRVLVLDSLEDLDANRVLDCD